VQDGISHDANRNDGHVEQLRASALCEPTRPHR
jgi:hypothetical protein